VGGGVVFQAGVMFTPPQEGGKNITGGDSRGQGEGTNVEATMTSGGSLEDSLKSSKDPPLVIVASGEVLGI